MDSRTYVSILVVTFAVIHLSVFTVTGQRPYSYQRQICCNGTVHQQGNHSSCCGSEKFELDTQQCCQPELTVIPLKNGRNGSALTCCGGRGVVADYNQKCCAGKLSNQPTVVFPSDRFDCCGDQIYVITRQTCCNSTVYEDADKNLACCEESVYDPARAACCNGTVVQRPPTSARYSFGCCGNQGYDSTLFVCSYPGQKLYPKPQNVSCQAQYDRVCGDQVIGPQQQCCNDKLFYAPLVWIDDGRGVGAGFLGTRAYCCPGAGVVQDPNKETCCGSGLMLPIDTPSQGCCGTQIYDGNVDTCCDGKIVSGSYSSCCGRTPFNYNTHICCGDQLYNRTEGYDSCCYPSEVYTV